MGDLNVRSIKDENDRRRLYTYIFEDLEAFKAIFDRNLFDDGPVKIGAEQELCLVHPSMLPATNALNILKSVNDPHFTNELALFNLEINQDPVYLKEKCFSFLHNDLNALLNQARKAAEKEDVEIILCGILASLNYRHLNFDYMTPIGRYETISHVLHQIRGSHFEIRLEGVDDLIMSLDTVLFEACNTSFQTHLQIHPSRFIEQYNWSQMIAGPVLSACTNSPLLFGNELWSETRIALFKQSLDTRSSKNHMRKKLPRVYFGNDWLKNSPVDLWKNEIMRFPLLITSDGIDHAKDLLEHGTIPDLRAIRLHNGTTYTWNRMCYGVYKNIPHLRIECRYLPSGPSVIDEIANFAFWVGLMEGMPDKYNQFWQTLDFRYAKSNFIKAAKTGLFTMFNWFGSQVNSSDLLLKQLIPISQAGLEKMNVHKADIDKYLTIIEDRLLSQQTGSIWHVKNYRRLLRKMSAQRALRKLIRHQIEYQKEDIPVHRWDDISHSKFLNSYMSKSTLETTVDSIMSTDIYTGNPADCIELAFKIFEWNNIHHLPIENTKGELVGIVTKDLLNKALHDHNEHLFLKDIMLTSYEEIQADQSIQEAIEKIESKMLTGLPVTMNNKLVGLITTTDIMNAFPVISLQT